MAGAWGASSQQVPTDNSIGGQLQVMQSNLQRMEQLYDRLGTPGNTRAERQQLSELRVETQQLAVRIKAALQNDRSPIKDKWVSELTRLTRQFHDLANRIKQKEQTLVAEVQQMSASNEENENTVARKRQTMAEYGAHSFKEVDTAIINETNKDLKSLERDMQDLVGIMQDVKTMTHEQGEQVNKIEANTYQADANVGQGRQELEKGESLANSIRKKKVIIIILVIVCLLLIGGGIALGVYFGTK